MIKKNEQKLSTSQIDNHKITSWNIDNDNLLTLVYESQDFTDKVIETAEFYIETLNSDTLSITSIIPKRISPTGSRVKFLEEIFIKSEQIK